MKILELETLQPRAVGGKNRAVLVGLDGDFFRRLLCCNLVSGGSRNRRRRCGAWRRARGLRRRRLFTTAGNARRRGAAGGWRAVEIIDVLLVRDQDKDRQRYANECTFIHG